MRVSMDEFETMVEKALESLPPDFADRLDNVVIMVEDEPTAEDLELVDGGDELLGIYRGVALIDREDGYAGLPDQVVLFRGPLLRICGDRRELMGEIRDTLVHELGHHFGLGDDEMPY